MNGMSKKALLISAAVHAALVAAILLPYLSGGSDVPGTEDVQVWLAQPSGDVAFGPGHADKVRKAKSSLKGSRASRPLVAEAVRREKGEGEERPSERVGGTGGAGGSGSTKGEGGSELLARIWRKINASKYYPSSAKRRGITGAPKVAFAIGENGSVKWARLVSSSGESILDDAAVETVRRAAPLPYYPKTITVAVKYSLRN